MRPSPVTGNLEISHEGGDTRPLSCMGGSSCRVVVALGQAEPGEDPARGGSPVARPRDRVLSHGGSCVAACAQSPCLVCRRFKAHVSVEPGSSTCVTPQPRHRARRGRTCRRRRPRPTGRSRAHPHGPSTPALARRTHQRARLQLGLDADQVRAYGHHQLRTSTAARGPPGCRPRLAGRASHVQRHTRATLPRHDQRGNHPAAPSSSPSLSFDNPTVLTSRGV